MRSRIYGTTTLAFVAIATVASWISTSAQEDEKAIRNSESRASANASAFVFPRIKDHGKVVRLPSAAEQPRNGSKICVDVTAGGPAEAMNPAVVERRDLAILFRAQALEPGFPRVHDEQVAACGDDA